MQPTNSSPMVLEIDSLSEVNALLCTALDKAEFSSDDEDEDNDAAKALAETFNRAISMNTSQDKPDIDTGEGDDSAFQSCKLSKKKQGKAANSSKSKVNLKSQHGQSIEPDGRKEIIDLTLEKVCHNLSFQRVV
jgi:hypothetical protein